MDTTHVLIIGIDHYDSTGLSPLQGSRNDAVAWYRLCVGYLGVAPENIAVLASPRLSARELGPEAERSRLRGAARAEITEEAERLAKAAVSGAGLLVYSGHGIALSQGGPSQTGTDLAVCPSDVAVDEQKGVTGALRFTELSSIFRATDSQDNITVFLDTCYSSGPATERPRGTTVRAAGGELELARRCASVEAFASRLLLGARHWTSAYEIQVAGQWRGAASFALQTMMERWALRREGDVAYLDASHADLLDRMGDMLQVLGVPQIPALWGARRLDEVPFLRPGLRSAPGTTSMNPDAPMRKRQVPVEPDHATLMQFADANGNPLIRVVVIGDFMPAGWTGLQTRTEYWYTNTMSVPNLSTLNLTVQSTTDQGVANAFIDGWMFSLSCGQFQGTENWATWQAGVNTQGKLLRAPDPTGQDQYMGLYLHYDKHGILKKYAWYRISLLAGGFAYEFESPPGEFTAIGSTDPNEIAGGAWKYSTLLPPGT